MVARGQSHAGSRAGRGPAAAKRRGMKADRDGDLTMDVAVKGRAGVSKSTVPTGPRKDLSSRTSRGGILSGSAQRAILRQAGAGDAAMKDSRGAPPARGLVEIKISNWQKSRASDAQDGGRSSLIQWLEKKASRKLGSRSRAIRIKKSTVEGNDIVIKVAPEDASAITRMNGFEWAGVNISVRRLGAADTTESQPSSEAEKVKGMLRGVLERRYNQDTKFLDLSGLGQDEELKTQQIFDSKSTASKFFPAMMRVLEFAFDTNKERDEAVISVSLANNDLEDLKAVSALPATLPKLQNLDLSNNKFSKLEDVDSFKRRLQHLQQLIVSGNPLEQSNPDYAQELIKAYRHLRTLNGVQVRTEEEIANGSKDTAIPFPIRSALFLDEGGIAENFVRTFYAGFDSDRAALAAHYYDEQSTFSYALNTQAPRDPAAAEQTHKQEWENYIGNSRNMKKISHLPARQARLFRGIKAVADIFAGLPATRHPNLETEARKWMIEAHILPGVPDLVGTTGGVDGFEIVVHGEFEEMNVSTGQPGKKRSFDRTFVVGPGGPAGVRVVSDMLTIRAYGGAQAFDPDTFEAWNGPQQREPTPPAGVPQLPAGMTMETAEQMVLELQKQTGMTVNYSKDCLDQVAWDFGKALEAFGNVRANLPPEAFVQAQA